MSDEGQRGYFHEAPPTQSTTAGEGITRIATAATASKTQLGNYPAFYGRRLVLRNEDATDAIWLNFSATGATAIDKTASPAAIVSNVSDAGAGTLAANGYKLLPGGELAVRLDRAAHQYLHLQSAANTPVLAIYVRSPRRLGDQVPP